MLTLVHQLYQAQFQKMDTLIKTLEAQAFDEASQQIDQAFADLATIENSAERLQARLFWDALDSRLQTLLPDRVSSGKAALQRDGETNLYLLEDAGQQIKMFDLLAKKFPLVSYAQEIANTTFMEHTKDASDVVFLDIGMGTGQQVANLLRAYQTRGLPLKKMTVLGIEPSANSLAEAEQRLQQLASDTNLVIDFWSLPKTMEQVTDADWVLVESKIQQSASPLLVNASFALHHVKPITLRTSLLARIKALLPTVFIMIEPYANFITNDLPERFQNAWQHYGLVFQAIDGIDATIVEKSALKDVFFGREIQDVLAVTGRTEQFETAEMWLNRHQEIGFKPIRLPILPTPAHAQSLFMPEERTGYIGLNVQQQPVVAIMGVH